MARRRERVCACISLLILIIIAIIILIACVAERDCTGGAGFRKAAVAADSPTCSKIGRDILQEGGSAVDGAIAALICTSIINPQSMGIGGGVIFTIMEGNGKVKIINARETAPQQVKPNLLSQCGSGSGIQQTSGPQWIGVPGEIRGYERAHRLYGRLPWAKLFQPTIQLARKGFKLPSVLARILPFFNQTAPLNKLFMDGEGNILKEGDPVKFEKYADTLERIAKKGPDEFYTGETASALVSDVQAAGGNLTMEDLKSFEVSESEAWTVSLSGYTMYFPPPPAGGAILGFILNLMQGYDLSRASLQKKEERVLTYHRYVEACKFANGLKKFMKDPKVGSESEAFTIIEKEFADHIRKKISSNTTHDAQYYDVTPGLDTQGTTHVSVQDENGMAVSVTSTINHIFGSRVYSPNTGIILNNELSDFCGKTDQIRPGEQPPSSQAPVILYSKAKKHIVVIGGSGGSMITTGMAMTLMNYLWFGKDLEDSIAAPIVYVDGKNALKFEPDFDKDVIEGLRELGHTVEETKIFFNVINAVSAREGECIDAVSDARKMGQPAGY